MILGDRRYIVCRNRAEAEKDAAEREAIVANLRRALRHGDKALVGNAGYRRFLKAPEVGFAIDEARVAEDARFDGIFVLRTNTTLDPLQAMLRYRELQGVEQLFRSAKSLLATRPIFHKCDATIRGHVFCSFLALVLQKELRDRWPRPASTRMGRGPARSGSPPGGRGRAGRQALRPAHPDHRLRRQAVPDPGRRAAAEHPRRRPPGRRHPRQTRPTVVLRPFARAVSA